MDSANYINHIVFCLDESGSMAGHRSQLIQVADGEIDYLATRSKELDQETRATIYTFNTDVRCVYYDKDVLRLPSIQNAYHPGGRTALIDATLKGLDDLSKTPELYGDHAFLFYVLTDGQENASIHTFSNLSSRLYSLPDHWTVACLVPDQQGVWEAKKFGFAPENISIWNPNSAHGVIEVGQRIRHTTDQFMQARQHGVRGSKSIFQLDASKLTPTVVSSLLQKLPTDSYNVVQCLYEMPIRDYIQNSLQQTYHTGKAYYQMTKPETIQSYKKVCVRDRATGAVYTGPHARSLIGLPDYDVRVRPADHPSYDIYIQSTSVNRKLIPGTSLLLMK